MNALPPAALERIAHNLCSLHDFDPAFVAANEAFALAVIAEYSAACPPPVWREISAIQADDIGREGVVVCTAGDRSPPLVAAVLDDRWYDAKGVSLVAAPTHFLEGAPVPAKPRIARKVAP